MQVNVEMRKCVEQNRAKMQTSEITNNNKATENLEWNYEAKGH